MFDVRYFDIRTGIGGGAGSRRFHNLGRLLAWLNSSETIIVRAIHTDDAKILEEVRIAGEEEQS